MLLCCIHTQLYGQIDERDNEKERERERERERENNGRVGEI